MSARKATRRPKAQKPSSGGEVDRSRRSLEQVKADIVALQKSLDSPGSLHTHLHRYGRRMRELERERDEHPETIAAALANLRLGQDGTGPPTSEPELGAELEDIATHLDDVEACVHTVYYALDADGGDLTTIIRALRAGAVDNITMQIERLRGAINGARVKGTRMVVVKEETAREVRT